MSGSDKIKHNKNEETSNAQEKEKEDIIEEIGQKEGELIRQHRPILNTQIPKEENWRQWEVHKVDVETIFQTIQNITKEKEK